MENKYVPPAFAAKSTIDRKKGKNKSNKYVVIRNSAFECNLLL